MLQEPYLTFVLTGLFGVSLAIAVMQRQGFATSVWGMALTALLLLPRWVSFKLLDWGVDVSPFRVLIGFLVMWMTVGNSLRRRHGLKFVGFDWAYTAFALYAFLAVFWSPNLRLASRIWAEGIVLPFLAYRVARHVAARGARRLALLHVVTAVGVALGALAIVEGLFEFNPYVQLGTPGAESLRGMIPAWWSYQGVYRSAGPLFTPVVLGVVLAMTMPIVVGVATRSESSLRRLGWLASAVVILLGVCFTRSRAAYVVVPLSLLPAVATWNGGARRLAIGGLIATVVAFGVVLVIGDPLDLVPESISEAARLGEVANVLGRFDASRAAVGLFEAHPMFGAGLGGFMQHFVLVGGQDSLEFVPSHNSYLDILADLGLAGMICYLVVLAMMMRMVVASLSGGVDASAGRSCQYGVLAAYLIYLVSTLSFSVTMAPEVSLLMFSILGTSVGQGSRPENWWARDVARGTQSPRRDGGSQDPVTGLILGTVRLGGDVFGRAHSRQ